MENPIYFASFNMLELKPEEMVRQVEDHGFDGVEILADGNHKLDQENVGVFQEIKNDMSLSVHAPFEGVNLASLNDEVWEESIRKTKKAIIGASKINADITTIHPGHLTSVTTHFPDRAWRRSIRSFRRLSDIALEHNTNIAIENMPKMEHLFCKHPSEIEGFIETVGRPNLKFTFDIGHANTNDNIQGFLEKPENIHHVHIHDNKGDYDSHLEIGDGNIDFQKTLRKLSKFNGPIVIEGRNLEEGEKSKQKIMDINS